jgi:hypothetical protein
LKALILVATSVTPFSDEILSEASRIETNECKNSGTCNKLIYQNEDWSDILANTVAHHPRNSRRNRETTVGDGGSLSASSFVSLACPIPDRVLIN